MVVLQADVVVVLAKHPALDVAVRAKQNNKKQSILSPIIHKKRGRTEMYGFFFTY